MRVCMLCIYVYLHNHFQTVRLWNRNSVIRLVTRLRVVRFRKGQEIYFFSETSQPVLLSAQIPMQWVPERFSQTARGANA